MDEPMNERDWAERFSREADGLLDNAGRTDSEATSPEYRQVLDLARTLATSNFSGESRVQAELRRRLLKQVEAREEPQATKARPRKLYLLRLAVWAGIVLVLAMVLLHLSPELQMATAQGAREVQKILVGVFHRPGEPDIYSPPPPFEMKQPGYLPLGFMLTAQRYYPGFDRQTGAPLPGSDVQVKAPRPVGEAVRNVLERDWGNPPYILNAYESPDGQYVLLFERAAKQDEALPQGIARTVANHAASLQQNGQMIRLTWIAEGTWIELETSLAAEESFKIAESLKTTPMPASASNAAQADQDLPFCDPSQRPPNRPDGLLGKASGQRLNGSVWINFTDDPAHPEDIAYGSNVPNAREQVFKPALAALQDPNLPMQKLSYPSLNSFAHDDARHCLIPDPHVQGYIVIEVWNRQVDLGYGGIGAAEKTRAIKALEVELQNMR